MLHDNALQAACNDSSEKGKNGMKNASLLGFGPENCPLNPDKLRPLQGLMAFQSPSVSLGYQRKIREESAP
jgi:hypothetical protein